MLFVLFVASNAQAQFGLNQQKISESQWRRGFHGFNMLAEGNGLEAISAQEFRSLDDSANVLLIAIGRLDRLPVNVTNHVENGGAALVASDSTVAFTSESFAGVRFVPLSGYPTDDADAFGGMHDCPVVSFFKDHPVVSGVNKIATNRPGAIWGSRKATIARLPSSFRRSGSSTFVAAKENRKGGRMVALGDQSIFTNQMIVYEDNALFADQAIKWLNDKQFKKMLFLVDGSEHSRLDPSDVALDIPPPTRAEVMDALRNLPPSAMLDFANSVATVVEDENMVNDFLRDGMKKVPDQVLGRFYALLLFGVACLTFIVAFLFQGKLQRQTASEIAFQKSARQHTDESAIQANERQQAAHFLLDKFCVDQANIRFNHWSSFPTGLQVEDDRPSKTVFESMTRASIIYKSKPTSYWTRSKLVQLEKKVNQWRSYFDARPHLAELHDIRNVNLWSSDHAPAEFN